jgi:Zn-dependent protease
MAASRFTVRPRVFVARRPIPIELTGGSLLPMAMLGLMFALCSSGAPARLVLGAAALGGIGGLTSLIVHELGHVGAARRVEGIHAVQVSLLWLGAGTKFQGAYRSGRDQARVAFAGPAASVGFAALLLACALMPLPRPIQLGLFGLSLLNLAIAVVSLVPVDPLDGHKLAVGLLWGALGSERRAQSVLRRAGRQWLRLELLACGILLVAKPAIGATSVGLCSVLFLQKRIVRRAVSHGATPG